jgi:hypothetical protein
MNYTNKVSIFRSYKDPLSAFECSVLDFCLNVVEGDYMEEVEAIREITDKKERDRIKATLPGATISGTFETRKKDLLISHSGFIAVDIDQKENPSIKDWEGLRNMMTGCENVFFSALSVSAKGVFLIIPIRTPELHEHHFDALKRDFRTSYNINIDFACRDVSRLRGISYDPEGKLNYAAIPYKRTWHPPAKKIHKPHPAKMNHANGDQLGEMVQKIIRSGVDITDDYGNWVEIGRALVNEYGEPGRSYFHQLSKMNPTKYNHKECDAQYNKCLKSPGQATKNTIFYLSQQMAGVTLK